MHRSLDTCATFIVALFDELGIPFIDVDSWEDRAGDAEWANRILDILRPLMSPAHVAAQQSRIEQTVRVRPADVTAAGLLLHQNMDDSLRFGEVASLSACVEAALLEETLR